MTKRYHETRCVIQNLRPHVTLRGTFVASRFEGCVLDSFRMLPTRTSVSILLLFRQGYRKIQNLEPYTSLKALWLGGNGLSVIQGIGHLRYETIKFFG